MLLILSLAFLALFVSGIPISAKSPKDPITGKVKVSARIGEFALSISGIISPYASVSLISGGNIYKAVVANADGLFTFSDILIYRGFTSFCLDAVDWRSVGESYTCLQVDPATSNIAMNDIFLPPTLGLDHQEITEGGSVIISGYSMPNAQVTIHVADTKQVLGTSDSTGYYHHTLKDVKKGTYELYAGARYDQRSSLLPTKKVTLKALSIPEYFAQLLQSLITWIIDHTYLFVIPSLLLLLFLIVFVLWYEKILIFLHLRRKKLHHAWFVGY